MSFDLSKMDWHYVNLAHRTDRRAHAEAEFAKAGISARRFEAYKPEDWKGDPAKVLRMRNRTPGAIGCMASQMAVIETVVGTDRIAVVNEDDVVFCEDIQKRLAYIAEKCPKDFAVFWLGGTFHVPAVWHKNDEIRRDVQCTSDPRILRTYGIWSTYSYAVPGHRAREVLDILDANMHRSDGIDHCAILYLEPVLPTYCFVPGCAKQYDSESSIGRGITRFSDFASLGPYWFQERMEQFDPTLFDWKDAR
jgi:GR25 family glycosyltransferase involved in LPS biosynthesis